MPKFLTEYATDASKKAVAASLFTQAWAVKNVQGFLDAFISWRSDSEFESGS
jgi:hypothetical protein